MPAAIDGQAEVIIVSKQIFVGPGWLYSLAQGSDNAASVVHAYDGHDTGGKFIANITSGISRIFEQILFDPPLHIRYGLYMDLTDAEVTIHYATESVNARH